MITGLEAAATAAGRGLALFPLPPGGRHPEPGWRRRCTTDPEAAARLTAAREAVGALSTEHRLPVENLLPPDALRRLAWEPPVPATTETITAALRASGARAWQAELTAAPLAAAFAAAAGA